MRHKTLIILIATISLTIVSSCGNSIDNTMCGQPEGKQKAFIDAVNQTFQDKFILKHVPCYSDYMRIDLKADYDKNVVDSLENAYTRTINHAEFLVYNQDGKLIRGNTGSM